MRLSSKCVCCNMSFHHLWMETLSMLRQAYLPNVAVWRPGMRAKTSDSGTGWPPVWFGRGSSTGRFERFLFQGNGQFFGETLRGNTIRRNSSEGNLPLRGRASEVLRFFEVFMEVFRGFSEVLSETLSEADFLLRGSRSCCPYSCCPLIFLQVLTGSVSLWFE